MACFSTPPILSIYGRESSKIAIFEEIKKNRVRLYSSGHCCRNSLRHFLPFHVTLEKACQSIYDAGLNLYHVSLSLVYCKFMLPTYPNFDKKTGTMSPQPSGPNTLQSLS